MRRFFSLLSIPLFAALTVLSAPFTPGNIVVVRVGDGLAALSNVATAVFLDEYTTSGTLVQSIPLPTATSGANYRLTNSGSATSEGSINLSSDKAFLAVAGYDAAPGTLSIASSATTAVVRVIGRISASGDVDTRTTTTAFSGNNIRSAVTTDGTGFWAVGGNTGVVYLPVAGSGAGTIVSSNAANNRVVSIFGGQLYISTGSGSSRGVAAVGSGTPTTTGSTSTTLPGLSSITSSSYNFVLFDENPAVAGVDVLYIADDNSTGGGILKYSFDGSNWIANGSIAGSYRGLTGTLSAGVVNLIATSTSSPNALVRLADNSGYNATITGTPSTIVSASANTAFRGVALTPGTILLPLQLLSFAATPKDNTIAFTWKTTNEYNTHHFEVEQSFDGTNFKGIATIPATGSATAEKKYSYTGTLNTIITFYRLKMVDADGKFSFSSIVKAVPSQNGFSLGNVYPVPAKNSIAVEWNSKTSGAIHLTLTDRSGRTIQTLNLKSAQGFNQYQLDIHSLIPGQYFLQLKNGSEQIQTIIAKQ